MITLKEAKALKQGQTIYHAYKTNADGTAMRAKVTSVKTWKRDPERVEVRVKHGLRDFAKFDETELKQLCHYDRSEYEYTRVNSDVNGNPRYVLHFLKCEPYVWKDYSITLPERYARVVKLMNTIGGRKFHNKQYGGGIVFQSYNMEDTIDYIERAKREVTAGQP